MNKFNGSIGGQGYYRLNSFANSCDISNFKQNDDLTYAVEHIGPRQIEFGKKWYQAILELQMLSNNEINGLLELNDSVGNPLLCDIHSDIIKCSPNSLKYIYFGLLTIKHFQQLKLSEITLIEIGGGYGGQCIITRKIMDIFNMKLNKYILIDLDGVLSLQKRYISNHDTEDILFIQFEDIDSTIFPEKCYLFSCYSFGELNRAIQNVYYTTLFPYIAHGFVVWNNKLITLPRSIKKIIQPEYPSTGYYFVYF